MDNRTKKSDINPYNFYYLLQSTILLCIGLDKCRHMSVARGRVALYNRIIDLGSH